MDSALLDLKGRIQNCTRCPLHRSRRLAVPGEGNPLAELAFVGQGPGDREDYSGRPFVGPAGELFEKLLGRIELERRQIWVTNVTRCKPSAGRLPSAGEIKVCASFLLEELGLIKPKIVCPLGNMALSLLRRKPSRIQDYRGRPLPQEKYFLFPMLHPAAGLRKATNLPLIEADLQNLKKFLASDPVLTPPPGQESLF